jgi:hypothetical protein
MQTRIIPMLVLSGFAAQADVLTPVQRFFGMGGQFPEYDDGGGAAGQGMEEAPFSPADSDLGVQEILVERSSKAPIVFDFSTAVFRTDSAPSGNPLTDDSAWVSSSSASLSWRPHLVDGWFGDLGIGQDFLRFDDSAAIDYENFTTRTGLYKNFPDLDDTVLFVRHEFQRLTTGSLSDGDYTAQRIRVGAQKLLWVAPGQQLGASLSGAYEWTANPDPLERNEISLEVYHRFAITGSLYTLATARSSYYDFDQLGREDWTTSLSLELIWRISQNFRASASISYDKNDSDTGLGANDYEAWNGGVGIGCQWEF